MSAPNLKEVEWAISELENKESSFSNYAKLASLYTVRKNLLAETNSEQGDIYPYMGKYSQASPPKNEPLNVYGDSEFLIAISGKSPGKVWGIIDELMGNLQAVNPRVYNSVIRKIKEL